jgi:excisionase family DNA binding protein
VDNIAQALNPLVAHSAGGGLPRLTFRIEEVAQILGVSEMSVRRMLGAGELKAVRRFRSPLIPVTELVRFVGKAR